jgi:hypothetical protein
MAGNGGDIHKSALGLHKKRRKCLSDGQWAPDVDIKYVLCSSNVLVKKGHEMVASSVVDQVRKSTTGLHRDSMLCSNDIFHIGNFQGQQSDARKVLEGTRFLRVADGGEDMVAACLEDEG